MNRGVPLSIGLRIITALLISLLVAGTAPVKPADKERLVNNASTPSTSVTIRGTITGSDGQPLSVYLSVSSSSYEQLGNSTSNAAGAYSFKVPYREAYLLYIQGAEKRVAFGADVIPTGHLDQYVYIQTTGEALTADFSLSPGGALWLQTYNADGQYLFRQDVRQNNWTVGIYPLGSPPTSHPLQYLNHQGNVFWGWRNGSSKNHPVLLVPSDEPVELWVYFPVPEVGDTYLRLDNDGKGYNVSKGGVIRINLLLDAAKTEYSLYQARLQDYQAKGYSFTGNIAEWNMEAGQALENAIQACQEYKMGECAAESTTVLTRSIRGREEVILQSAQQDIEQYRKKDIRLQVQNCDGTPLGNSLVDYQQVSQDFIIGAGWPLPSELGTLSRAGVNGAIDEAWWGEVTADGSRYNFWDDRFAPITKQGMNIIMHTGIWISPITNPNWYFFPRVIENMPPQDIANLAYEFSNRFTSHYRDRMVIYNAFNEPQNAFYTFPITMEDIVNIADQSVRGARQGAPEVPTYINFYNTYLGDMSWYVNAGNATYPSPDEILQALLEADIPFDNIGLEFYSGIVPATDFGIYNDNIEYYGRYGKQVFISELSYGSNDDYPNFGEGRFRGDWHGGHTDAVQAEWTRYAYTIAFSKPYVTGITWVPAGDSNTSSSLFGYGLLHSDGSPRLVLETIGDLTRSWTTSGSGTSDGEGALVWRGFSGRYQIRWTDPDGAQQSSEIHVVQDGENVFALQPSNCPAPTTIVIEPTPIPVEGPVASGTIGTTIAILAGVVAGLFLLVVVFLLIRWRAKRNTAA